MSEPGRSGHGRRQRRRLRDGFGPHGDIRGKPRQGQFLGTRTTTRMLVAAGTCAAQDLRDADGLLRPVLRRAALCLALSSRYTARRLGDAYLRLDPPPLREETQSTDIGRLPSPSSTVQTGEAQNDVTSLPTHDTAHVEPGV